MGRLSSVHSKTIAAGGGGAAGFAIVALLKGLGVHLTVAEWNLIPVALSAAATVATPANRVQLNRMFNRIFTLAWRTKHPPAPPPVRLPLFGIDWAWGAISPRSLRAVGAGFAARYLSSDPTKNLSPRESADLKAAGLGRVVVWETSATRALQGLQAGMDDAGQALAQARKCGLPRSGSWAIYFAIDADVDGLQVAAYFRGVASVIGSEHAGAYGGIRPLSYLLDQHLIRYGWQTYAWSGGQWDPRAQVIQFSNGHTVAGVSCDFNRALKADYGQW